LRVIVGPGLEAPAVVTGLDDVAVVGQAIEQRIRPNGRGVNLDADNPAQGVKIARPNTF